MNESATLIHFRTASLGLTHKDIAERMSEFLSERVSKESVQSYFSGKGVPIEKVLALLYALNWKQVDKDEICLPLDRHQALVLLAADGINSHKR